MAQPDTAEEAALEPENVIGTHNQYPHLLAEAAEIEHALMCGDLYAACSLKRVGEPAASQAQGDALERWRKTIIDGAVAEMGQLVIVPNLSVAVGGQPHFARAPCLVAPGHFPSGVAVRLARLAAQTLEHFIFLERPRGVDGHDGEAFEQPVYRREQARVA